MKKVKTILILVITILIMMTVRGYAAEKELTISGDSEAKAGEQKELLIKVVSDEDIGVFEGTISYDENISNINVQSQNDWNKTYNENNKKLLCYKDAGAKNEDVIKITYTLKADAKEKASIKISDIKFTTTSMKVISLSDVTKEITIKTETPKDDEPTPTPVTLSSIEITKVPTKIKYTEGEKFDKTGMEVTAKYSDGTSKKITDYTYTPNSNLIVNDKEIEISYTENGVTKTVKQAITVEEKAQDKTEDKTEDKTQDKTEDKTQDKTEDKTEDKKEDKPAEKPAETNNQPQQVVTIVSPNTQKDNTVANKELSKAGIGNFVFYAAMAISVVGAIFYIKYAKMKDVK